MKLQLYVIDNFFLTCLLITGKCLKKVINKNKNHVFVTLNQFLVDLNIFMPPYSISRIPVGLLACQRSNTLQIKGNSTGKFGNLLKCMHVKLVFLKL